MGLRDMYAYTLKVSKDKFHGTIDERDGKLYFKGTVATDAEKNEIWTAIKTIPTWQKDIVADIRVTGGLRRRSRGQAGSRVGLAAQDLHGEDQATRSARSRRSTWVVPAPT